MKLFVTGGTGFVGSNFIRYAVGEGASVEAIRRVGSVVPDCISDFAGWIEGDLGGDFRNSLESTDCLVHFAAAGVDPTDNSWETCFEVNVNQSLDLWRQAIVSGVRHLVVIGSCSEYGNAALRYENVPPDAPLEPVGPYAASKAAATMAAIGLSGSESIAVTVLRLFHIFGEGEEDYRFWPSLRKAANDGTDFPMTAGEQVRDFTSVDEACRKVWSYCQRDTLGGNRGLVKNIGTGKARTLLQFAEQEWASWDAPGRILAGKVPYRENEIMRYVPAVD